VLFRSSAGHNVGHGLPAIWQLVLVRLRAERHSGKFRDVRLGRPEIIWSVARAFREIPPVPTHNEAY
jgi:hypothetical protein